MQKKTYKKNVLSFSLLVLLSAGCSSVDSPAGNRQQLGEQYQKLEDKMFANRKADNHIEEIKQYVLDQYPDLPDDVELLIKNTNPKIVNNEAKMEYAFFWVLPDGSILEVITTPPPLCELIGVHHGKNIKYE